MFIGMPTDVFRAAPDKYYGIERGEGGEMKERRQVKEGTDEASWEMRQEETADGRGKWLRGTPNQFQYPIYWLRYFLFQQKKNEE